MKTPIRLLAIPALAILVASCAENDHVPYTAAPDTTPPAAVSNLKAQALSDTSVYLGWSAPGDDDNSGTARTYELKYSRDPIEPEDFASEGEVVVLHFRPREAGSPQGTILDDLHELTTYYFALETIDEVGNRSALSNVALATTLRDSLPPDQIKTLNVVNTTASSVTLTWVTPGDQGGGRAQIENYVVRYSTEYPWYQSWDRATPFTTSHKPKQPGDRDVLEVTGLGSGGLYSFAIKSVDSHGNVSLLSNVVSAWTRLH